MDETKNGAPGTGGGRDGVTSAGAPSPAAGALAISEVGLFSVPSAGLAPV